MRWFLITLALVMVSSWTSVGRTGEESHGIHCPRCHEPCFPTVTKAKETKQCWEVETKTICIPKVRFPWESRCCDKGCGNDGCVAPKGGRTKCVNVLRKHEYECSTCKYSWDADSHKYQNGQGDKTPVYGEPTAAAPTVSVPPSNEASLPTSTRRVAPVAFEQSGNASPAKKSCVDVLTASFK